MSPNYSANTTPPFDEKYEELMSHIDRAATLTNFAIATRFDELNEATIFSYFNMIVDEICQIKAVISYI